MYSFQTGSSKRKSQKTIRILSIVIFVLAVALIGLTVSYLRASSASRTTSDALMARATNEANEAQTAVYRLTQSSGTNTMTLLSNVRAHIYAMQCLNTRLPIFTARARSSWTARCSPTASPRSTRLSSVCRPAACSPAR